MKKYLFFTIFIAIFAVYTITSCSNEKKDDLNYKKACELKDFSTAYEIVDKLKEIELAKHSEYEAEPHDVFWGGPNYDKDKKRVEYEAAKKNASEAERYVVMQEAMYVLESQGADGLMRILGITKEHEDCAGWLYNELLDITSRMGDKELYEKMQHLGNSGYGY